MSCMLEKRTSERNQKRKSNDLMKQEYKISICFGIWLWGQYVYLHGKLCNKLPLWLPSFPTSKVFIILDFNKVYLSRVLCKMGRKMVFSSETQREDKMNKTLEVNINAVHVQTFQVFSKFRFPFPFLLPYSSQKKRIYFLFPYTYLDSLLFSFDDELYML